MDRKLIGLVWLALVASCVGCKMCQTPYDYCASTIGPNGQPTGGFMTRQGSVLGGMPGVPVYQSQPTLAAPTLAAPPAAQAAPGRAEAVPDSATSAPLEEGAAPDAQ